MGGRSVSVDVAPYFTDPDGDVLTYTARSSRAGVVTAVVSGSTATLTAVAAGTDYHAAFAEAAAFGPAVDRFFTDVLVMAGDPGLRRRRLALLKRLEHLILQLADVSALVKDADQE